MLTDPVRDYIETAALYLHKTENVPIGEARKLVTELISGDTKLPTVKNPGVTYLAKDANGDRVPVTGTLYGYIKRVSKKDRIIVPSFTSYIHPDQEESEHVGLLNKNIAIRSVAKKRAIQARSEGDIPLFVYQNTFQKAKKLTNNALSGTYGSEGTALYNPSAHYTLTSMTRCVSSIGNAVTEKMVAGNRHYRHYELVPNDFFSMLEDIDLQRFKEVCDKYKLYLPNASDCMSVTLKSTRKYWRSHVLEDDLLEMFTVMSPYERAMFVYINDLYHFAKYNPDLSYELIDKLSTRVQGDNESVDPIAVYNMDDMHVILAHHVCASSIAGLGRDYVKYKKAGVLGDVYATTSMIDHVFDHYGDLFETLFYNNHMPISTAYIYDMLREVTVLSDTDSTCATYQDWVIRHVGELTFDDKAVGVSAAVMIINSKAIRHYLKLFSKRMRVAEANMDALDMKNEFYWPIMTPTNVTKHYYAGVLIQEGSVFKALEPEIKGAHLIASKTAPWISEGAKKKMMELMEAVIQGKELRLSDFVNEVVDIEQRLMKSISEGDPNVFLSADIKDPDSYKQGEEESNYRHHLLWKRVFEPKYGYIDEPPYNAIKVPLALSGRKEVENWLSTIEDVDLRDRLIKFFDSKKTIALNTLLLSSNYVIAKGIPEEILRAVDYRRIITEALKPYYLILETLGYYVRDDMIVSDHFTDLAA